MFCVWTLVVNGVISLGEYKFINFLNYFGGFNWVVCLGIKEECGEWGFEGYVGNLVCLWWFNNI